jgi:hypothetical protein
MKNTLRLTALMVLLLTLGARPTYAQAQFTGWLGSFQNYKLSPKMGLYFDGQFRSTDQWRQMNALLLRPGINFYFTPSLTGTVGYAFIPQQRISNGVTGYLPEHRTWQQLTYAHATHLGHHARTTTIAHRLRLEQRYIPKHHPEGNSLVHDRHVYAGRLRYFARAVVPVPTRTTSSGAFSQGLFAAVQNEVFFNIGDPSNVNGKVFDQNRAYLAMGYRYSKQFDVEMGYLNQYISGTGSNSTVNHVLQLATYLRL